MANPRKSTKPNNPPTIEITKSRSIPLAEAGPRTVMDIANLSLAIATDVVRGFISANSANAASSAIGKTLKAVELQLKHGPKDKVHVMLK